MRAGAGRRRRQDETWRRQPGAMEQRRGRRYRLLPLRGGRWRSGATPRPPRRPAGPPARAAPRPAACRASARRGAEALPSARRWALAARPGAETSRQRTRVTACSDYALASEKNAAIPYNARLRDGWDGGWMVRRSG